MTTRKLTKSMRGQLNAAEHDAKIDQEDREAEEKLVKEALRNIQEHAQSEPVMTEEAKEPVKPEPTALKQEPVVEKPKE